MRKAWLLFSQAVTVAVALLFVVATLKPQWLGRGADPLAGRGSSRRRRGRAAAGAGADVALIGPGTAATGYSAAAKRASPAVVSITASKAPQRCAQPTTRCSASSSATGPGRCRSSARSASARA